MNTELFINAAQPMSESIGIQTAIFAIFLLVTFLLHSLFRLISYYYPRKRFILKMINEMFGNGLAMYLISITCSMLCTVLLLVAYLIAIALGL